MGKRGGAEQLKSLVERVERLEEEIAALNGDKSEVYREAKGLGFDLPALRAVIAKRRKMAKDPRGFEEHQSLVEAYEAALDAGTPIATRARARDVEPPDQPHDPATGEILAAPAARPDPPPAGFPDIPQFLQRPRNGAGEPAHG